MNRRHLLGTATAAIAGGALWLRGGSHGAALAATEGEDAPADIDTSSIAEMALGSKDAPVTVIEYASFTCPHCAHFHATTFKDLKRDYIDTGKVRFIFREVYFDRVGLWASMLARCGGPMRFFGIVDMLFDQQREWLNGGNDAVAITDNLRKIGKVAGLTDDQVDACLNDQKKAETLVAWFDKNKDADDIDATPTLVIDGKKYGNMAFPDLKKILDEKLAE